MNPNMKVVAPEHLKVDRYANNLAHDIKQTYQIEPLIIARWNSLTNLIREKMIVGYKDISPTVAEKYIFDFAGLLRMFFNMEEEFIYPHIIANGFFSSTEYDGNLLRIALLDKERLLRYNKLFYADIKK